MTAERHASFWKMVGTSGLGGRLYMAGIAAHEEEGVNAADAGLFRIVDLRVFHALVVQIFESRLSLRLQFVDFAEHDGLRGAGLGAGRLQA